jgi:hypothetical protein
LKLVAADDGTFPHDQGALMAMLRQYLQNSPQIIAKLQENGFQNFSAQAIDLRGRSRFPAGMDLITTTESLSRLCESLASETFITVDTEFNIEEKKHGKLVRLKSFNGELFF